MTRRLTAVACMAVAVMMGNSSVGWGDDAAPTELSPAPLPSELKTDPLDLPPGESDTHGESSSASDTPDESSAEDDRGTEEESVSEEEFLSDPFPHLESDMQSAVVDLKDGRTHPPAVVTQPRILSRLDILIAQLEKSCRGGGPAGNRAVKPAGESTLKPGPGGRGEMRAPKNDGRDWADLTPKEREKILQSRTDGFPAGFDAVLADYFRRVARGQESAATADDAATPESEN